MKDRTFADCSLAEKFLYTAFLLLMGMSYLMALVYLYTHHWHHDGKPGLSVEDIAETYYGNRSGTQLEAALRGGMGDYIDTEERHHVIAWLKSGAGERDYESTIRPILERNCVSCHGPGVGFGVPDLSTYSGVHVVADVDTGESLHTLIKVSHIHLFGVGLVLLGVGLIFRFADLRPWIKHVLILVPFCAIFADVLAWFLTKWDPHYAYTVVISGALLALALAAQILISLFQLWFLRAPTGQSVTIDPAD